MNIPLETEQHNKKKNIEKIGRALISGFLMIFLEKNVLFL